MASLDKQRDVVASADDGVRVRVRVAPGAARAVVAGIKERPDGPALAVSVTVPPEGGKANRAVTALLAKEWKVAKGTIRVASGQGTRDKVLFLSGDPVALSTRLNDWLERLDG